MQCYINIGAEQRMIISDIIYLLYNGICSKCLQAKLNMYTHTLYKHTLFISDGARDKVRTSVNH